MSVESRARHAAAMRAYWADPVWRAKQVKVALWTRDEARRNGGFLYVAEIKGTDVIKIGFSRYPAFRIGGVRSTYKVDARLMASTPAKPQDEVRLHQALKAFRRTDYPGVEFYHRSILSHAAIPAELRSAA